MENIDLINSFSQFKDDKFIDRVTLMAILEEVFRAALKRKYGEDDNFDIIINPDKGDLEIWRNRIVVNDGEVEDDNKEISLAEARKIEPDFEVGEDVSEEVKLAQLGRRAILSLRQNLIAKIHEHDNTNIFKQFKDLEGEIYTAEVHHVRHKVVILIDDDGNELIIPKEHQIPRDFYRKGDSVRGVIHSVELRGNKPSIILSRTSPVFLEKLFEQEIPEVFDGLITVQGCVRVPGEKAKVAVDTYDDRIDPVGACVGMRGSRIHGIVRELGNENIDVINFTKNTHLYITRALSPAKVASLTLNEENKTAEVLLKPEEVSKAANNLYLIKNGVVKTFQVDDSGKELITGLHKVNSLFGNFIFKKPVQHKEYAAALENSEIHCIPKQEVQSFLEENHHVLYDLIDLLDENLEDAKHQLLDMAYSSVQRKTAQTILLFTERLKRNKLSQIRISRSDLAAVAGIASESLIRTLSKFKKQGIVEIEGRNIKINDFEALERIK